MSAVLSECGRYRYLLERDLGVGTGEVAWIMINPSTADARVDDATIRKVCGFSQRWGYRHVAVVNLYAYRATDVRELRGVRDPRGPHNARWITHIMGRASRVVAAWGRSSKFPESGADWFVRQQAKGLGIPLWCLGKCADGHPRHPLMIGYDCALEEYETKYQKN